MLKRWNGHVIVGIAAVELSLVPHKLPLRSDIRAASPSTAFTASTTTMATTNGTAAPLEDTTGEYVFLDQIIRRMDRHLIYPLLDHESHAENISQERADDLKLATYNLLKNTNMVDFVSQLHNDVYKSQTAPAEFDKKKQDVLSKLGRYEEETAHLSGLLNDEAVTSQLRSDKVANLKFLEEQHNVTQQMVDALYDYGRFKYECGQYPDAADILYRFRVLSTDNDKVVKATWGKLVCEILSEEWEQALEEVDKVKEHIDTRLFNNPRAQLTARESLVHYALFPFFNYEPAKDKLTELYFSPAFISSIQTACPWILRYLAAAVITNRARLKTVDAQRRHVYEVVAVLLVLQLNKFRGCHTGFGLY